jgi:syntaxin-binding protein 1
MTYSEMREAYLLSKTLNKDIIIGLFSLPPSLSSQSHTCRTNRVSPGSSHAITPKTFIDDLKVLELNGVGSRAMPNGPSEWRGPRSFQEFYDEIYYTRDAPPPQRAPAPSSQREQPGRSAQPSPISSYASGGSSVSGAGAAEKEKKKKKGFLRF